MSVDAVTKFDCTIKKHAIAVKYLFLINSSPLAITSE